jgi:hypothetical protein
MLPSLFLNQTRGFALKNLLKRPMLDPPQGGFPSGAGWGRTRKPLLQGTADTGRL